MNPESAIPGTPNPVTVSTAYPESTFPVTAVPETLDAEKNAKIANENKIKTEILESMNPECAIPGTPNPVTVSTAYPESTFPATAVLETLDAEKKSKIANQNQN